MPRPLSYTTISILNAIAAEVRYGFDIMDRTELPSGTVYPALSRLERDGLVQSRWEDLQIAHGDRRPPRRYYSITARGKLALATALEQLHALKPLRALDARPERSKG